MRSRLGLFLLLVAACGGASATPKPAVDAAAGDASRAKAEGGVDAAKDAGLGMPHDAAADGAGGATDASDGSVDVVTDAPFDATGFVAIDGGGGAITGLTPDVWSWVPFPDSRCRDGSTTGLGVNWSPASKNLLIYMEEGGACFNGVTCSGNPSSFAAADFAKRFPASVDGGAPEPGNGILDRTNAANPVADWSFVYVPYCTGDIHAGNNPAGVVEGLADPQMFVGYQNVNLFLQRIVPTFPAPTEVLLAGLSGGGFGAAANYAHVARAYGSVPVDMLDDSGPFMRDPYIAACLQDQLRALWGLDSTVGADCDGHCNDPGAYFLDLERYVIGKYPSRQFGLIEATDDGTISNFFGFGASDCTSFMTVSPTLFAAGLDDIRSELASDHNLGTYYFPGRDHTTIGSDAFYERTTTAVDGGPGPLLTSWVGALVSGKIYNAGP